MIFDDDPDYEERVQSLAREGFVHYHSGQEPEDKTNTPKDNEDSSEDGNFADISSDSGSDGRATLATAKPATRKRPKFLDSSDSESSSNGSANYADYLSGSENEGAAHMVQVRQPEAPMAKSSAKSQLQSVMPRTNRYREDRGARADSRNRGKAVPKTKEVQKCRKCAKEFPSRSQLMDHVYANKCRPKLKSDKTPRFQPRWPDSRRQRSEEQEKLPAQPIEIPAKSPTNLAQEDKVKPAVPKIT